MSLTTAGGPLKLRGGGVGGFSGGSAGAGRPLGANAGRPLKLPGKNNISKFNRPGSRQTFSGQRGQGIQQRINNQSPQPQQQPSIVVENRGTVEPIAFQPSSATQVAAAMAAAVKSIAPGNRSTTYTVIAESQNNQIYCSDGSPTPSNGNIGSDTVTGVQGPLGSTRAYLVAKNSCGGTQYNGVNVDIQDGNGEWITLRRVRSGFTSSYFPSVPYYSVSFTPEDGQPDTGVVGNSSAQFAPQGQLGPSTTSLPNLAPDTPPAPQPQKLPNPEPLLQEVVEVEIEVNPSVDTRLRRRPQAMRSPTRQQLPKTTGKLEGSNVTQPETQTQRQSPGRARKGTNDCTPCASLIKRGIEELLDFEEEDNGGVYDPGPFLLTDYDCETEQYSQPSYQELAEAMGAISNQLARVQEALCKANEDTVLALPDDYGLKPETNRPTLVLAYKERKGEKWGKSSYSSTIFFPKTSIISAIFEGTLTPPERQTGPHLAQITLPDGSSLKAFGATRVGAESTLAWMASWSTATPADWPSKVITLNRVKSKTLLLKPRKAEFYPSGTRAGVSPTQERYFNP